MGQPRRVLSTTTDPGFESCNILLLTAADAVPKEVLQRLPGAARRVLDELRRAGRPLGIGQLAELLGMARPTAGRHLATLRDHGLVVWEGDSPKDPRAIWRLS